MKKLIAILSILMVIAGVAFAENNDQLLVTAKVDPIKPIYAVQGKISSAAWKTGAAEISASNTIATDTDISTTPITVDVRVNQTSLAKYQGAGSITVKATALANTTTGLTSYKTNLPTTGSTGKASVDHLTIADPTTSTANGTSDISWALTYNGENIEATEALVSFSYTWAALSTLPVGSYSATITLVYTPV